MATSIDYVTYVLDRIQNVGKLRYKKMFGEYMIYIDDKPTLLLCDDTVFVKKIDDLKHLFLSLDVGFPYPGAKEHYILDIDDPNLSGLIKSILPYLKIPKKKVNA